MSWYGEGFDADLVKQDKEEHKRKAGARRFWMPPGATSKVVFVDDQPAIFYEHQFKKGGSFKNWVTCKGPAELCCEKLTNYERYLVAMFTIVNCTKWTDRDGKEHKFVLEEYPAKGNTRELLEMKKKQKGSLKNRLVTINRTGDKQPNCGNDFDFDREVNPDEMFAEVEFRGKLLTKWFDEAEADEEKMAELKHWFAVDVDAEGKLVRKVPTFNYRAIHEPLPNDMLLSALAGFSARDEDGGGSGGGGGGSKASSGGAVGEDDIPF